MSHIGKEQINIPLNVKVSFNEKENLITIKGKHGELNKTLHPDICVELTNNTINVKIKENYSIKNTKKDLNSIWGLNRTLVFNMIKGVNQGHMVRLQLVGIGYKAKLENNSLVLKLGFSHNIRYMIPNNISISVIKPTLIYIWGTDVELVTQIAANIRSLKEPEPFNGKGIKYLNEIVKIKEKK
jgi:large subunit ribosomal protein L6